MGIRRSKTAPLQKSVPPMPESESDDVYFEFYEAGVEVVVVDGEEVQMPMFLSVPIVSNIEKY